MTERLLIEDYDIVTIDLSKKRTNTLIKERVIAFTILDLEPHNAYAEIKLFDVSKPTLRIPDDIGPGSTITGLKHAKLFITNPAQPRAKLKILVLTG